MFGANVGLNVYTVIEHALYVKRNQEIDSNETTSAAVESHGEAQRLKDCTKLPLSNVCLHK